MTVNKNEIAWDLTEMFQSPDDPKITERIENLSNTAADFVSNYKGKINSADFTYAKLLELFKKQEAFL
ncbi:MAG: hypothetical protein ACW96S_09820, partial [Promethearchaeota archaeon]